MAAAEPRKQRIAALWAFDKTERYPPQFIGAVSDGLYEFWDEEAHRIRMLAEEWFSSFDDEPEPDRWTFDVFFHAIEQPRQREVADA